MKKLKLCLAVLSSFTALLSIAQAPFAAGNVAVFRQGDGIVTVAPFPVFIDEYTPAGVLVQSIALPTTASGSNHILTTGGNAAEGMMTLSVNGQHLALAGYDLPLGYVGSISASATPRVVGMVDYNASVNTSTALTSWTVGIFPRTAVTTNGTDIWVAGSGGADSAGGIRYVTVGSSSSVQLYNTRINGSIVPFNALNIFGGQLYSTLNVDIKLAAVGTGLPTTAGQSLNALPGFPTTGTGVQFVLLDMDPGTAGADVLYLSDPNTTTGGILKYSLVSGSWTYNGRVGTATDAYRGLTGKVSGGVVTLYATTTGTNTILSLTDASGYNGALTGTPTVLVTAGTNEKFKGIAFAPQPPPLKLSAKIFLQGAYSTILSRHKDVNATWATVLDANALTQPFNIAAFGNYAGTETVSSGFFTSTAATTDILDWILVELRDPTTPTTVIARRAAFVREDGKVVDLDGTSDVNFPNVGDGNYYIVIRHRNHLGVRSASAVALTGGPATTYDFTTGQAQAFQDGAITTNAAMKDLDGGTSFGMWAGNANSNTTVRFTGLSNDAGTILSALGGNQAAILSSVYNNADLNMDGTVRFTGLNNDAGVLLSVLGSNQAAVYTQHQ